MVSFHNVKGNLKQNIACIGRIDLVSKKKEEFISKLGHVYVGTRESSIMFAFI